MAHETLYSALDSAAPCIRLLNLHPGNLEEDIVCHFVPGQISQLDSYEALSYVWGNQEDLASISVDKHQHFLSKDLAAAIRRLRLDESARLLWIDQVCINQHDVEERNSQVSLMRDIYSSARQVIVWFGEGTPTTDLAISFMNEQSQLMGGPGKESPENILPLLMQAAHQDELMAIAKGIILRPWWQRAWIIQEIVLARDATLVCGSMNISWQTVTSFIQCLWEYRYDLVQEAENDLEQMAPKGFIWHRLQHVRKHIKEDQGGFSAWKLVLFFRYCESTLPEDRIYSLLGLCSDIKNVGFDVDYSRHHHDTFKLFTKSMTEANGSLNWLCHAGRPNPVETLPSWCPDFEIPAGIKPDPLLPSDDSQLYNASGNQVFNAGISPDASILCSKGVRVDSIGQLCHGLRAILKGCHQKFEDESTADQIDLEASHQRYGEELGIELEKTVTADRIPALRGGQITRILPGQSYRTLRNLLTNSSIAQSEVEPLLNQMNIWLTSTLALRSFFVSKTGWVGLVPEWTKIDDLICILFGFKVPVVLRQQGDHYIFIGEWYITSCFALRQLLITYSYVARLMDGEVLNLLETGDLQIEDLKIQ